MDIRFLFRSFSNTNSFSHSYKFWTWKCFSKHICQLIISRNVLDFNFSFCNLLSNIVVSNQHVLCSLVKFSIVRQPNGAFVITEHWDLSLIRSREILEEAAKPYSSVRSLACSNVFSFGRGQSRTGLLLT